MAQELNFESPENEDRPEEQEEQPEQPEEQPQEEETEADPTEQRFQSIENALSETLEYLRNTHSQKKEDASPQEKRPAPNFGDNTPAQILWDELQALRKEIKEPWERVQKEREKNDALAAAEAALLDQTVNYVASRKSQGDPDIDPRRVVGLLISMGQLANPRIPITEALKNAYNASAFDEAKKQTRNQTFQDARKPDAKIPAPYRRPVTPNTAGTRTNSGERPGETKSQRLKREMEAADQRLSRFSPDDLADAFGSGNL